MSVNEKGEIIRESAAPKRENFPQVSSAKKSTKGEEVSILKARPLVGDSKEDKDKIDEIKKDILDKLSDKE